jgi:hypothetical protein
MARPSKFDQALLDGICERLAEGVPLTQICRDLAQTGVKLAPRTVRDWEASKPDVSAAIARARELGEYALAEECLVIADTPLEGEEVKLDKDGNTVEVKRGDMLGHRKLQIETRLKLLAKFNPKRWGDKVQQEITGANGGPIETLTSVKLIPLK